MIESNVQQQQRDVASNQQSHSSGVLELEAELRVKCAVCDAVYAPTSPQLPLLQHAAGTLDTAFMHMCHFCFRCRRAACPQCWDEVHGVCGSCVQEAHLTFRAAVPPLDGLLFSPPSTQPRVRKQQASPNF